MDAQQKQPKKNLLKWLQKGCCGPLEGWGPFGKYEEATQYVWVYPEEDSGLGEEPPLAGPPQEASLSEAHKDQPGDHEFDQEEVIAREGGMIRY